MKVMNMLALALLIVGGLNWGLVALANFDLVRLITTGDGAVPAGYSNILGKVVYGLVAAAGVYACSLFVQSDRRLTA
jgi:uncharacterized membrane protein YuzA (DUF378 family)